MATVFVIDGEKFTKKEREHYAGIFEQIMGISRSCNNDDRYFIYIGELIDVLNSFENEEKVIVEHYFGLNGYEPKDIGAISLIMKGSFIFEVVSRFDKIMKELREMAYTFDAMRKINFCCEEVRYISESISRQKSNIRRYRTDEEKCKYKKKLQSLRSEKAQFESERIKTLQDIKGAQRTFAVL